MSLMEMKDKPPTLEEAQKFVGGYVKLVMLPDGDQMLVNEEGRLRHLEINHTASELAGQMIVGPAMVLRGKARWT